MYAQKMASWKNTLQAAIKPAMGRVMLGKLARRITGKNGRLPQEENKAWLERNASDLSSFLLTFSPLIQSETQQFQEHIQNHALAALSTIPYDLGGGAGVPLLYALVRKFTPDIVVETGVAAGFSSATILTAMERNQKGMLFSSDFPYFRIKNPEQYIGIVVEQSLKSRWSLLLKGDEKNLPEIVRSISGKIGLFHYDSDKSYEGREFAMRTITPYLAENAIIVMDDIHDNSYFHDYVSDHPSLNWSVFFYAGKYIGLIGHVA